MVIATVLIAQSTLYAQKGTLTKEKWQAEMKAEEIKIDNYIAERMNNKVLSDSIQCAFLSSEKHEEYADTSLAMHKINHLRNVYRQEYFSAYPGALQVYNPGRVNSIQTYSNEAESKPTGVDAANMSCDYGDFETATPANLGSQGYNGYQGPTISYYTGGLCNFIPTTNVAYPNVGFSDPNNFLVTDNIPDPNVPAINQTHNGSKHAIRINGYQNCGRFGINMLQKSFQSSVSGTARINFSYALVMQGPHDGSDAPGNAFFVARVLDENGIEVGTRICVPAHSSGAGFEFTDLPDCSHTPGYMNRTLWRDWGCDFIEFNAKANKTYTVEFFVSACKWNVHYAYAYVDDICADVKCCHVPAPPENLNCEPKEGASYLSWDPVPGAVSYKVYLVHDYLTCCGAPNPPTPIVTEYLTSTPNITVSYATVNCFSWKVLAIMPDGCETLYSNKECSCWPPPPPPPTGGKCTPSDDGSVLSWNPVPGAAYYKVFVVHNYELCCPPPNPATPIITEYISATTTMTITNSTLNCFSWKVKAVMPDSIETFYSDKQCSCSPVPPPPDSLKCTPVIGGSYLSWAQVPGAAYYKVYIAHNYQDCCPGPYPPAPVFTEYITASNNMTVSSSTVGCFSWKVMAVMSNGLETLYSYKLCSCTPPRDGNKPDMNSYVDSTTGISILITPNPAADYIKIRCNTLHGKPNKKPLILQVYNSQGMLVLKKQLEGELSLDVRSYNEGSYFYEALNQDHVVYKGKFQIRHH